MTYPVLKCPICHAKIYPVLRRVVYNTTSNTSEEYEVYYPQCQCSDYIAGAGTNNK